jgi:hypothetical protein
MPDPDSIVFPGSTFEEFWQSDNSVAQSLPIEMRKSLTAIVKVYFARYGLQGVYERMNNRTVTQIFAEYQPEDVKPIISGEKDGVRYALYEGPPDHSADSE